MQIQIDQARLLSELQTLATLTDAEPADNGTAVTRVVFSPDDLRARAWLKELAVAEGFEVRDDAVGNIFIRWAGHRTRPARRSHRLPHGRHPTRRHVRRHGRRPRRPGGDARTQTIRPSPSPLHRARHVHLGGADPLRHRLHWQPPHVRDSRPQARRHPPRSE